VKPGLWLFGAVDAASGRARAHGRQLGYARPSSVGPALDSPRVTVVVPTYRRPVLLVEALESILAGSYSDFEVLVVNDGDEDDLLPARSRFDDPRIRWITRPQRLGMLANNIDAYRLARGEFVAHLDDDDLWAPTMLSTLVPILESHPEVVVAFGDHFVVDEAGVVDEVQSDANSRQWGRATLAEGIHRPFGRLAVVDRSIPLQCASVVRRSAMRLDEYTEEVGSQWDTWTVHLLSSAGGAAWYVPERLAYYRWHGGNDTAVGGEANLRSFIYCFERFRKDDTLVTSRADIEQQLVAVQLRLAAKLLRDGNTREARRYARRAAALRPTRRSVAFALAAHVAPARALRAGENW
jgi:glycosyltransferase involved in cell wall biosynthesis